MFHSVTRLFLYVTSEAPQGSEHVTIFSWEFMGNSWPRCGLLVMTLLWDYSSDWSVWHQREIKLKAVENIVDINLRSNVEHGMWRIKGVRQTRWISQLQSLKVTERQSCAGRLNSNCTKYWIEMKWDILVFKNFIEARFHFVNVGYWV